MKLIRIAELPLKQNVPNVDQLKLQLQPGSIRICRMLSMSDGNAWNAVMNGDLKWGVTEMTLKDDIQSRMAEIDNEIIDELDEATNNPIKQWATLKVLRARQLELEWVMNQKGVN